MAFVCKIKAFGRTFLRKENIEILNLGDTNIRISVRELGAHTIGEAVKTLCETYGYQTVGQTILELIEQNERDDE